MPTRFIVARFHAKAGCGPEVERLLAGFVEPSRDEDGCLFYDLCRDADDHDRFVIVDGWRDHAAFEAHAGTERVRVTIEALRDLLRSPPEIAQLDCLSAPP